MAELFQNKYRIESARLKGWDYGSNRYYFVTICTNNRTHFFGRIQNDIMCLNEIGTIAYQCWLEIPNHFPFVVPDEFVIMPNHVHGIVHIDKNTHHAIVETPNLGVSTMHHSHHWKPGNLGVIINQYKRACTIQCRKLGSDFAWQPRFHDRVIRDESELNRIREYIQNNPMKWWRDRNNPNGLWM